MDPESGVDEPPARRLGLNPPLDLTGSTTRARATVPIRNDLRSRGMRWAFPVTPGVRGPFPRRDEFSQAVPDVESPGIGAVVVALDRRGETDMGETELGLAPFFEMSKTISVPFHSVLSLTELSWLSVTCQTALLSGIISETFWVLRWRFSYR